MHVIAVNGSPRNKWNTATLLQHGLEGAKSVGATIEMVNLYDLTYRGCTSCFACKRKSTASKHCAMKDELTPVLEKILKADALLLGSPIYFSDVTGEMRSFMERLLFPFVNYDNPNEPTFAGSISSAFFFTMNMPPEGLPYYRPIFENNTQIFGRMFRGGSEYLACYDTYQFDDYAKHNAAAFNEENKRKRREEQFPQDCQRAFEIGAKLGAAK